MDDTTTGRRIRELTERVARIEDQLVILSAEAGVPYERPAGDEVPASVRELAAAGRTTEAIVELRRLKAYSLGEAKEIVEGL